MMKNIFTLCTLYMIFSCANPVEKETLNTPTESLLPNLDIENGIEIVTWNIEQFPKLGQRTIDSVASIITSLNADIYCLQEISDLSKFIDLVEILDGYSYVESNATEYLNLVVLYKNNQFLVRNQSDLFTDSMYDFASRPPLRIEMTFTGENPIDFTLINMHLKCCDNGFNRRVSSANILYDYLNSSIQAGVVNHIIVGDWNMEPEELQDTGWLEKVAGKVIIPPAAVTCAQGKGSLIDYIVVNEAGAAYVEEITLDAKGHWKPHLGYTIWLSGDAEEVEVQALARPRKFDQFCNMFNHA